MSIAPEIVDVFEIAAGRSFVARFIEDNILTLKN
jgi:hypothetical protein